MDGVFDLAQMLTGGGAAAREKSFYDTQQQIGKIQHLSAQTQQALEQAKVAQRNARKAEMEIEATDQEADAYLALGAAKSAEEARAMAVLGRAQRGNFPQLMEGRGAIQEQGFLADVANPKADLATRLGASSGLTQKVQLAPEGPTPQVSNFAYREGLAPDAQTRFDAVAPEKFIAAGGIPYSTRTGQPLVDPDVAAANAGAIAGAKTEGQGLARRALDLPQAKTKLAATDTKIRRMEKFAQEVRDDQELWKAVGLGKPIALIPGTAGARIRAKLNTLRSQIGLAVLQDLRDNSKTGGAVGQVSDFEQRVFQQNIASLDDNLHPEDLREQLNLLLEYLGDMKTRSRDAFLETYPEISSQQAAPNDLAAAAAAELARRGLK